ncbi:MAG: heavy metal-associated domain-containing protein [Nocardioides sp.]|uniref:heavy-metal-associated domain-containing protein n=1 Tax=Nocardioides sp. TaxID=35761 RepID=UPI0039E59BD7
MSRHTFTGTVAGMTCDHCVASVTEEIGALAGVSAVTVDLASGALSVEADRELGPDEVRAAVADAGYQLT